MSGRYGQIRVKEGDELVAIFTLRDGELVEPRLSVSALISHCLEL